MRKSFTDRTRKIVKDKCKKYLAEQNELKKKASMSLSILRDDISKQKNSLTQWVFDWIQIYKKPPVVKETTYSSYMVMWEKHIEPFFGTLPLAAITNQDIQVFYNFELTEGHIDGKEGELLALTWEDVDLKKHTIRITKDLVRITAFDESGKKDGTKRIVQETPKSQKSNRVIPLQEEVFKMLMFHKQCQENHKQENPLNLVFSSKVGTHTEPRTYQKRIAAVSKRCEIQHVNVHALRHTFATRLVEQQVPIRIIQELLGHSSVTTTMRYTHALEEEKGKVVDSMNGFIIIPSRQA